MVIGGSLLKYEEVLLYLALNLKLAFIIKKVNNDKIKSDNICWKVRRYYNLQPQMLLPPVFSKSFGGTIWKTIK